MIREITIGQYYQADSVLHRLDPRVKLIATIVYIVSLFLYREPVPLLFKSDDLSKWGSARDAHSRKTEFGSRECDLCKYDLWMYDDYE